MNYTSFIVKIIEKPEQSFFDKTTSVTQILVKLPQNNNFDVTLQLSIWGNLAYDAIQYYQINDYIVVEGYISLRVLVLNTSTFSSDKQIEISVFKIYPFIMKKRQIDKFSK